MRRLLFVLCVLAAGCAPPKVLVAHSYATSDKSIEALLQRSGETAGTGQARSNLFNVFMRVCNQGADNTQSNCKDTVILDNVKP